MKKITINDVAREAGVSKSTVSFVLNRRSGVRDSTRRKVLDTIKRLGYKPQFNFAGFNNPNESILCLQVQPHGNILTKQYPEFVRQHVFGARDQCEALSYRFEFRLLLALDADALKTVCDEIEHLAGIVVIGSELNTDDDFHLFGKLPIPVVFIDTYHPYLPYNFVDINNESSVFSVVDHLYQLGHRKVGIMNSIQPSYNFASRKKTFFDACRHFGLDVRREWYLETYFDYDRALGHVGSLFDRLEEWPTALFCVCDVIALAVHKHLQIRSNQIGGKSLYLVGFDNLEASGMVEPGLSTVNVSKMQIAKEAIRLLHEHIYALKTAPLEDPPIHERILIGTKIIHRT